MAYRTEAPEVQNKCIKTSTVLIYSLIIQFIALGFTHQVREFYFSIIEAKFYIQANMNMTN